MSFIVVLQKNGNHIAQREKWFPLGVGRYGHCVDSRHVDDEIGQGQDVLILTVPHIPDNVRATFGAVLLLLALARYQSRAG